MKSVKENTLMHNLLLLLSENDTISVSRIASILDTSESTIRRKIERLNDALLNTGYGYIEKTPRKGLHLVVEDRAAINKLFANYELKNIMTGERQIYKYLILILSSKNNRFTLNELSERVYDSIPVVRKNLAVCEEWLSLFELHLSIKKNVGITLEGSEESIRLAMKHIVINNDLYSIDESIRVFAHGIDLELLKKCIFAIESEWNFKFTEESFNSMLVYAALAIIRSSYTLLNISDTERKTVMKYNEYSWSKSLFKMIEEKFSVKIEEDEIIYFAVQLLCSYLIHSENFEENNAYKYDEKLKTFITRIISVVSDVMNVDLTKDKELYYGLLNHIRPAIFRMRFEKHSTKTLTNFIKEEYKQTYRVSWALSILFEEYYSINISSTELSYITLYIQSSLDRMSQPVNMALVTELGMGLNQLFCNKIKISVPKVEKISIISLHDFEEKMLEQYDLIVTTSSLKVKSDKVVQLSSLLSDNGISMIKQKIEMLKSKQLETKKKFDVSTHTLFDPKLIFTHLKVKNKEELLALLSKHLVNFGYVSSKYHASILKREKTVSTYIGNRVAIPHGNSSLANESKVAIALLDEAIQWDAENEVDTVFLLVFRISSHEDSKRIQLFYKGFLELIETDEKLKYLRSLRQDELYKYLVQ